MDLHVFELLHYLVRWLHVIAAVSWGGRLILFLAIKESEPGDAAGDKWITHGDGFYLLQKRNINAGNAPKPGRLKTDILLTWVSGVCLLALLYYSDIKSYAAERIALLFPGAVAVFAAAAVALSWFAYDLIWLRLGLKHPRRALLLSFTVLSLFAYGFCRVLAGPAAYIHVGAMLATWMLGNAWLRNVPVHRIMVEAAAAGRKPNRELALSARQRSVHNSFLLFPVVLLMMSGHFAAATTSPRNWIILLCLVLFGLGVCYMLTRADRRPGRGAVGAAISLAIIVALVASSQARTPARAATYVSFTEAQAIIANRCTVCHSAHPSVDKAGEIPPNILFDSRAQIQRFAGRINSRAVLFDTMPPNNRTEMTEEERRKIGQWFAEGAPAD